MKILDSFVSIWRMHAKTFRKLYYIYIYNDRNVVQSAHTHTHVDRYNNNNHQHRVN